MNIVFTLFFLLEMIVKLFGLGFKGYAVDTYNIFDAIIVVTSLADLLISNLLS